MFKLEVKNRVLKDGKSLPLRRFNWMVKNNTFVCNESDLTISFTDVDNVNIDVENCEIISVNDNATIKTTDCSTVSARDSSTINVRNFCKIYARNDAIIKGKNNVTIEAYDNATIEVGDDAMVKTHTLGDIKVDNNGYISCGFSSNVRALFNVTIHAQYESTIKTLGYANIKTGGYSTIKTGDVSIVNAGVNSTIKTGNHSMLIFHKNNKLHSIETEEGKTYQTTTYKDDHTFLIDGISVKDGKNYIIVDGILSEVIHKKGNVYKVINNGEKDTSYIIKQGDIFSHGKTLKDAKDSLIYKLSDRDTSKYEGFTLSTIMTKSEAISCFRAITGACEEGVKLFVESLEEVPEVITIDKLIEITKGNYGNEIFQKFFKGEKNDPVI